eukprot:5060887-Amphidinium_carterae.1
MSENYTFIHQECQRMQKEFAEVSSKWEAHLAKSCEYFDTCWTEAGNYTIIHQECQYLLREFAE